MQISADSIKIPILVIVGATASGKTALGVGMAKRFKGEIVSADSMQIYEGMDIATAKPDENEMQGIKHHLIGFLPVGESFSVAKYVSLAGECIKDIAERGKLPIVVGGTGLYIDSLVDNIVFPEITDDRQYREHLKKRAEAEGAEALLSELSEIDPETLIKTLRS